MAGSILFLAGDGIGPEVVAATKTVLAAVNACGRAYHDEDDLVGGAAYESYGVPLHEKTLARAKNADAILLGAVGGPQWEELPFDKRPERGLLALRKRLDLFANLRPAIVFAPLIDASTLKVDVVKGLDILIVRELTSGIYFGEPRGIVQDEQGRRIGRNSLVYHEDAIERILRLAFDMARQRTKRLCSVDKANVLECTALWRDIATEMQKDYQDVTLTHMYVDNAAMQLIRNPSQFDVIVTTNMFGDILSDEASMLTGSLGMLPSASLGEAEDASARRLGMYEPVHGSAPDIAGKNRANPLATILSLALMFRYSFGDTVAAVAVEDSVQRCLQDGYRCADIAQDGTTCLTTEEMGHKVASYLAGCWQS